jgi:Flp pilus assembly secretin CpaC
MSRGSGIRIGATILLVLCCSIGVVAAAEKASAQGNVLLTVRIGKLEGDRRVDVKSYELVIASGGGSSSLLSGSRVPIPTASFENKTATFVYQNVGFSTNAEAKILSGGRIRIVANIEDSQVRPAGEGRPPTVETRQVSVNAILTAGKPLVVTKVEGIRDMSGFVEVEAEVLP